NGVGVVAVAIRTMQSLGIPPVLDRVAVLVDGHDADPPAPGAQCRLDGLGDPVAPAGFDSHPVLGDAQRALADRLDAGVTLARQRACIRPRPGVPRRGLARPVSTRVSPGRPSPARPLPAAPSPPSTMSNGIAARPPSPRSSGPATREPA